MRWINRKKVTEWLEAIVIAAAIAGVMFFLCWPLQIEGTSMEATLSTHDRVFVSRLWAHAAPLSRGDIVLCDLPGDGPDIIKRVIGLPNDRVVIGGGTVSVNGETLTEPYVNGNDTSGAVDITLSEDEYFVLGDNRPVSQDSRALGAIPKGDIIAKVLFRFYPFDRFGTLSM